MNVRSLALTTELGLAATRGRITDRGDYLVVETPDDPIYYFGNYLVLPHAPQVGEVAFWTRRFAEEFDDTPGIKHVAFRWDGITGDTGAVQELRDAGFTIEVDAVLVADEVQHVESAYEIRTLTPDEIPETGDLAWAVSDWHDEQNRAFLDRRASWQQRLVARGLAKFWGAFDADELGGSLGLVPLGSVARYQDVVVRAEYRRRGLASALLSASARDALESGADRVVIVAIENGDAARLYARLGFSLLERTVSACRYPPIHARPLGLVTSG